jgi:uncharacterized membrane protein YbaN (DUF454 family)
MVKQLVLVAAGWIAVFLGVAGLFLPVLPGILLLLVGLWILSAKYHWARRWSAKLHQRFPETTQKVQRLFGMRDTQGVSAAGD